MDDITRILEVLKSRLGAMEARLDEPMRRHTSFKIGGPVRAMLFPGNANELVLLLGLLRDFGMTPLIIARGTNLLVTDKPLEMIAVNMANLSSMRLKGEWVISADCGARLSALAEFACSRGLSGVEFAHGIPGSVGGAVLMNAGAYGGEMKDVVLVTTAYNAYIGEFTVRREQHDFSYRHSRFSDTGDIVVSTEIGLKKGSRESIREKMDELGARRRESQPLDLPSAGSTFKRPKDGYAAELIEKSGLKGFAIGGAQVSEKHSGFVVNRGEATFSDVLAVIEYVRETVLKRFCVELELEVKIIS